MNWYKLAQAGFQTFNMENLMTEAFLQHYNNYIKLHENNPDLQSVFEQKQSLYIGSTNIEEALAPIINHYGKPKSEIPTRINFFLMSRKHPQAKQHNAFFLVNDGDFVIGKIMDNIKELTNTKEFSYSVQHELQHFLKSLYEGNEKLNPQPEALEKEIQYLEEDWEIQSYSHITAKRAMDDIQELYSFRLEHAKPENIPGIKAKLIGSKDTLVSKFLLPELKSFFDQSGNKIGEEARRKYYVSTIRSFNKLFDKFVSSL